MNHQIVRVVSPGRVNLLGEHVDKNGGKVLPLAINRSIKLTAEPRNDQVLCLHALDMDQSVVINLNNLDAKVDTSGNPLPGWALYPTGVAWSLKNAGFEVSGIDCKYSSDIPIGAGLSSSAAVEVGFAVLWQSVSGWQMDRLTLAQYCQKAEVEYANVNCGLMDQFACANGVEGHAVLLDTRSLEYKPVPLPRNTAIVIADSSVRRTLVASAYNERVADCKAAVAIVQKKRPSICSLRDISVVEFEKLKNQMPEAVYLHARHVVGEIERVDQAILYLEAGDSEMFGKIMFETHASLRDFYEVSCPELDLLVDLASEHQGCIGARLTGAGFGGCTVNLVEKEKVDEFIQYLSTEYTNRTKKKAAVFSTLAMQGAFIEE